MLVENVGKVSSHSMTENNRIGDLHHRRFHVQRKQDPFGFGIRDLLFQKSGQLFDLHHGRIDHLPLQNRHRILQHGNRTVIRDQFDSNATRRRNRARFFVRTEIAFAHRRHIGLRIF